jgi:glycosidase
VKYTGYHGYWPASLDEVEPRFGSKLELQELVNAAHARGIRVLLDFTANHVHSASSFWNDHQSDGSFHTPPAMCGDVGWDAYAETCWFDSFLPDINYDHPPARQTMVETALYWVEQTGADGYRFDAVKHLEMSFVNDLRAATKAHLEHGGNTFYIVGETFTGDAGLIMNYVSDDRLHGQFDFPSNLALLQGFGARSLSLSDMDSQIRGTKGFYGHETLMSTFLGNHDIARFASLASGHIWCGPWDVTSNKAQGWLGQPGDATALGHELLRVGLTYTMTVPGVPLLYYGDEIGLAGAGDPDNRRFMRFDGDLSGEEAATLSFVQRLLQARRDSPALRRGEWTQPLWNDGDVLAWARTLADDKAVVIVNRSDQLRTGSLDVGSVGVPDGTLTERLSQSQVSVSGGSMSFSLPPRSAWVLLAE